MVRRSEGSEDTGLVGDPVPVDIQSLGPHQRLHKDDK